MEQSQELISILQAISIVAEGNTKDTAAVKTQKAEKQDAAESQPEQPATLEGIRALMAQKTQKGILAIKFQKRS